MKKILKSKKNLFIIFVLILFLGTAVTLAQDAVKAEDVDYNNTLSKLSSTTVQDAIDELSKRVVTCPKGYKCTKKQISNQITEISYNNKNLIVDETSDKNIRYIGNNPDNYVSFNNELWRIVGLFNNVNISSNEVENLVKIVKDDSNETKLIWDNNLNDWLNSNIENELNTTYLNTLDEQSQNMIKQVSNKVSSYTSQSYSASEIYVSERINKTKDEKVSILYPSDYVYAASDGQTNTRDDCLNISVNKLSEKSECKANNWLYNSNENTWLNLYDSQSKDKAYYLSSEGNIELGIITELKSVKPVVYLTTDVYIKSGTGTKTNPYILSL